MTGYPTKYTPIIKIKWIVNHFLWVKVSKRVENTCFGLKELNFFGYLVIHMIQNRKKLASLYWVLIGTAFSVLLNESDYQKSLSNIHMHVKIVINMLRNPNLSKKSMNCQWNEQLHSNAIFQFIFSIFLFVPTIKRKSGPFLFYAFW
jgi:hypothetical protein